MKKILINAPLLSRSGYGEMSRFALEALRTKSDEYDLYVNVINWGQTGYIFEETEEFNFINYLRLKTENYLQTTNNNPDYDLSLQITIPNEWKKLAKKNIGYTAGIETSHISPAWFDPSQQMDKIIVISEFSKSVFKNTVFANEQGQNFSVTTPIDVVHFPYKEVNDANINLDLDYDYNFLTVNQWGPRKNLETLISCFIEEFKDEEVGLVIKTNKAADSQLDKHIVEQQLSTLVNNKGDKKCKIYLIHGHLNEKELHGLYRHPKIKTFVTTTHGEGFGLPIFEAANNELPVLATDWSGHLDFLNGYSKDGELKKLFGKIEYEIKPIQQQFVWPGVMEAGTSWAYPTINSIKSKMREAFKDYGRFKSWAKKVSSYNKEHFKKEKIFNSFLESVNLEKIEKKNSIKPINGISFCIPTAGFRKNKTDLLIKSIERQNWGNIPYEIIICGSIKNFHPTDKIKLIDKETEAFSRKVAILRNSAAKEAKYENIVFCDDDIILSSNWLDDTRSYSEEKSWNVLGNKVLLPDGGRYWDRATLNPHTMVDYETPETERRLYQSSAFFMIRREVFEKVKWDETKLVFADQTGDGIPEDVQFTFDLYKNDFLLSFNKNALVWHNDNTYVEWNKGNIYSPNVCLKKQTIQEKHGVEWLPPSIKEFEELIKNLN